MHRIVFTVFAVILASTAIADSQCGILFQNTRRAFIRGETANLKFVIHSDSSLPVTIPFTVDIEGVIHKETAAAVLDINAIAECAIDVDTAVLKPGRYGLKCRAVLSSGESCFAEFEFWVAKRQPPDRMPVWLWGGFGSSVDEESKQRLKWYCEKGFNAFQVSGLTDADCIPSADQEDIASRLSDKYSVYFQTLDYLLVAGIDATFVDVAGGFTEAVEDANARFATPVPYGSTKELSNPFHTKTALRQNGLNRKRMQAVSDWPNLKFCWFNTEIEDFLLEDAPGARKKLATSYPDTVAHAFMMPGVIPDNDEGYVKMKYRFQWGDGLVVANRRAAEMVHRYRSDITVFTDPYRLSAVYDRFTGLDAISTWTYTNPDPKYMLYIETLIAAAYPENQGVIQTITMLNYPGTIFPKDKGWTLMGPDRFIETSWINLSRRPDALSVYHSSACNPFSMAQDHHEPFQKYPPSFEAMKRFCDTVVKPYGPMIRRLDRVPRRVAVLSSQSSRLYPNSPTMPGYYDPYHIYDFYALLAMIHIPADVVLDETIIEYGLDDYDTLILPKCETLLKSVYDRITAFQARGGTVIADSYLRAPLHNVISFNFDFSFRNRVSADAIAENKMSAEWNDHIDVEKAATKDVRGITAAEDQLAMEKCAAALRSGLDGKIQRRVDCLSPTVLMNMLEKDGVLYLFVINDKRVYDERTGPFKAILEKTEPQKISLKLYGMADAKFNIYDMIARKAISFSRRSQECLFDVELSPIGGTILAISSQKLHDIEVRTPKSMQRGCSYPIDIYVRDKAGRGMQGFLPLDVQIRDSRGQCADLSGYYAVHNGVLTLNVTPALNDTVGEWMCSVQELMLGKKKDAAFKVVDD